LPSCDVEPGGALSSGAPAPGEATEIGIGVYVDREVRIGNYCGIQNGPNTYRGVTLKASVFVDPRGCSP